MKTSPLRNSPHAFAVRLMEHLVVPTFVLDDKRRVMVWNRACERLTGIPAAEVVGTSDHWRAFYEHQRNCLADVIALRRPEELASLYEAHTIPCDTALGLHAETWCLMPRIGKQLYLAIDAGPIFDEDGVLIAVVETLRDITVQKLAQNELEVLARRDGLTGLANRRAFDERLMSEWLRAQRDNAHLSLLLADIDHFKRYNDTYGHQKGDLCLSQIARAIDQQVCRPADLAARYGGEEFVIIMPSTDRNGALQVAERIRLAVVGLGIPHSTSTDNPSVTMSIGIASAIPTYDQRPDLIISKADEALYAAKRRGRNQVVEADWASCPS